MDDPNPETGDDVTITVIPDESKVVDKVTVKDANGQEIPVTDNGDGSYTYEQPAGDVTIEVTFKDKPHEHSYTDVVTKPTCTERGYTTYTRECGDSYVAPTGHSFTRYHSDRNATASATAPRQPAATTAAAQPIPAGIAAAAWVTITWTASAPAAA